MTTWWPTDHWHQVQREKREIRGKSSDWDMKETSNISQKCVCLLITCPHIVPFPFLLLHFGSNLPSPLLSLSLSLSLIACKQVLPNYVSARNYFLRSILPPTAKKQGQQETSEEWDKKNRRWRRLPKQQQQSQRHLPVSTVAIAAAACCVYCFSSVHVTMSQSKVTAQQLFRCCSFWGNRLLTDPSYKKKVPSASSRLESFE